MSTGTTSLMKDVISLGVVATACALGIAHFDSIKTYASLAVGEPMAVEPGRNAGVAAPDSHSTPSNSVVELKAGSNGHYQTEAEVNGRAIHVLVDTGATMVALTYEDAENAGLFLRSSDFTHTVSTANGTARVAPVMLDRISIGDITVRNVQGVVTEQGKLQTTLLGMSFLSRLARVDMRSGTLMLHD